MRCTSDLSSSPLSSRSDVGGFEDGADLGAGDRTPPVVGVSGYGFERLLAESVRRKPWVAEDRPAAVPRRTEIEFDRHAENHLHEVVLPWTTLELKPGGGSKVRSSRKM